MNNLTKIFNSVTSTLVLFVCFSSNGYAQPSELQSDKAYNIMKQVDERYEGDTQISQSQLILIDKNNRQRVRDLTLYSIDKHEVEKSLIQFNSPADVNGTSYMSYDWQDLSREDDSWLYLPALQDVRRVAAGDESGSFMGSDFSYADINGLELEDFNYQLEKDSEIVDGHDCWVIRSTPKNKQVIKETGYLGATAWIRKDIMMQVKGIIEVKKGKKKKYFAVKDIRQVDGIWTGHTLQMVTTKNDKKLHASQFIFKQVQYNQNVQETMFSTSQMQRGF